VDFVKRRFATKHQRTLLLQHTWPHARSIEAMPLAMRAKAHAAGEHDHSVADKNAGHVGAESVFECSSILEEVFAGVSKVFSKLFFFSCF